eukprot:gnl/Hemi2/12323_TR4215_c0_g1_i1.p1 gnl/Hemi2/12323_TR4215_c0_g1~~gnl/Hemi2/12323_TR4215_c0_g1_i1.p1  ORF type:complete len:413 (-),score=101.85 gnl/Hemi2/12323_TR4215_c0_g1_i1:224-1462(-)
MGNSPPPPELTVTPPQLDCPERLPSVMYPEFQLYGRAADQLINRLIPGDGCTHNVRIDLAPDQNSQLLATLSGAGVTQRKSSLAFRYKKSPSFLELKVDKLENVKALLAYQKRHQDILLGAVARLRAPLEPHALQAFKGDLDVQASYSKLLAGFRFASVDRRLGFHLLHRLSEQLSWGISLGHPVRIGSLKGESGTSLLFNYCRPLSPTDPSPSFEFTTKITQLDQHRRILQLSLFNRIVAQRACYNPLEKKGVNFINNNIDIGFVLKKDLTRDGVAADVAASWQVNKNHLFKVRYSQRNKAFSSHSSLPEITGLWAFRVWWDPTLLVGVSTRLSQDAPSLGFHVEVATNKPQLRYYRPSAEYSRVSGYNKFEPTQPSAKDRPVFYDPQRPDEDRVYPTGAQAPSSEEFDEF